MNAIAKISARAKQIQRTHPSYQWKDCIKKASEDYRSGKLGRVVAKKKKPVKKKKYKQTGTSDTTRDKQRKSKPPGVRRAKSGNTYIETRKNRSDAPGRITGVPSQLSHEMKQIDRVERDIIWSRAQMKSAAPDLKRRLKAAIKYSQKEKAIRKKNIANLKRLI